MTEVRCNLFSAAAYSRVKNCQYTLMNCPKKLTGGCQRFQGFQGPGGDLSLVTTYKTGFVLSVLAFIRCSVLLFFL